MPRGLPAVVSEEDLKRNPEAGRSGSQRLREPRISLRGDESAQEKAFKVANDLVDEVLTEEGQSFFDWRKAKEYRLEYTIGVERDRDVPPASTSDALGYDDAVNLFQALGAVMKDMFNKGTIEHYYVDLNAFDEKGRKHTVTRHKDDRRKMRL